MNEITSKIQLAEQIDAICDQYEQDYRSTKKPSLEECLKQAEESLRPALFQALLELDIELKRHSGEEPDPADYLHRFPIQHQIIHEVFENLKHAHSMISSVKLTGVETSQNTKAVPNTAKNEPLQSLGRFQIKSVLGEGAFGTVYRAFDPQLDREVAIKVPRFGNQQSTQDRERFLREAKAAANLQHPQICPVHEVGSIEGIDYIVLSFIDGKTLSKIIESKPKLTDRQIVSVIRKIALGLQEAHEKGIIHRDLKPANIMINKKGEPVIMDFGLARRNNSNDAQISHSGQIMGTPAYMSPEQARGENKGIGPATDIYSLGVILYELLAGRRPFEGTITEVIGKILHVDAEAPSQFNSNVNPVLEKICLKAIAKNPDDRFNSMKELAQSLLEFAKSVPEPTTHEPAKKVLPADLDADIHTTQFARLLAAMSSDVESKVEKAVIRVSHAQKIPWWNYLAGSGLMGIIILLGILFFIKKDTVTVIVNIPIENINDPELSFVLDEKPIAATAFASPIELKPGKHELIVNKNDKLFKRFVFDVGAKQRDPVVVQDVTPETVTPEEIFSGLQGRWIAVEQARGGATLSAEELQAENKVMTISDNLFAIEYQLPSNRSERGKESGIISRIDPNVSPPEIDMVFERGTAGPLTFKGIFELKGDRLRHCYRKCHEPECLRPTDFTTENGQAVFYVDYKRGPALPIDDGWVNLFNGKDLTGWEVRPSGNVNWKIRDEVLTYRNGPRSHLVTDRDYKDFHLTLEMRQNQKANSGLWFWCLPTNDYPTGFETEISATQPLFAGSVLRYNPSGWAEAFHAPKDRGEIADRWFAVEVIVKNGRVKTMINGITGVDVELPGKYHNSGRIALQSNDNDTEVEFRNIRIKNLSTVEQVQPPKDVTTYNGHSYKFFPEQLSWKTAKARCEALGGHLVIVETSAENAFLSKLITDGGKLDSWIGATDEGSEGQWRWVDGRNMTWTNWFKRQNQPNNKGGVEHFGLMSNRKLVDGFIGWEWSDQPNESQTQHQPGYVCEWDAISVDSIPRVNDPDRKAAESLLSLGRGFVKVNGEARQIRLVSDLPTEPFRLTGAYFADVKTLDDNALSVLKDCVHLTELDLRSTRVTEKGLEIFRGKTNFTSLGLAFLRVTDSGLEIFKDNKQLRMLFLHDTYMTDKGLSLFHNCKDLDTLWVGGTPITDAGMLPFRECKFLKWLDVRATKVSRAGAQTMKAALPACRVDVNPDIR